jgi:O-antigen/teichoic acid export membrane protein
MKEEHGLLKSLLNFSAGPVIGALISMVTVPIITRMISPGEFGKSSVFTLFYTIFNLIALLGLDQAFFRYYNTGVDKKKLLYNSVFLPFVICFLIIIGIFLFRKVFSLWLFDQYEPLIMFLLCCFLPLLILNRFALLIIRAELRGRLYSILNIISSITNFICLSLLLSFFERSFRSIIYATILSTFINTIVSVFFTKDMWAVQRSYFDKEIAYNLLHFGMPLVPATVLSWGLNSFDKIGLKTWSSLEQLGLYAAAFKIVSLLSILQSIFTTAWWPIAYKWYEDKEDIAKFDKVNIIVLSVMTIGYIGIVIFRDFIVLFLGHEYRESSPIFIYLLFIPVMYTISETTTVGIAFLKKTQFNFYISLISIGFNIFGNYMLIPQFGARGAAISTAISYLVFFVLRTFFSRRLWYRFKLNSYVINFGLFAILVILIELNMLKFIEIVIMFAAIVINIIFIMNVLLWKQTVGKTAKSNSGNTGGAL